MLKVILKEYETGKCSIFVFTRKGLFFNDDFEVKMFTTKPRKKVPKKEELENIVEALSKATLTRSNDPKYPQRAVLKDYPGIQFLLKQID